MSQSFLLGGLAVFSPERNVLISVADASSQISLSNPASRCLLLLIQHHGRVVERDYFFQHVWLNNGARITNNNFYQNISLLRRAFKECGLNEELIVTVPRVGILLAAELEVVTTEDMDAVVPLQPAAPLPEPPPVAQVARRCDGPLCLAVLMVAIGLLVGFLCWYSEFDSRLQAFVPLENREQCRFYANPDVMDNSGHMQFIQQHHLDCQQFHWVYLTAYPNFQRVSALSCRQQYSPWHENQCVTRYYLEELAHVEGE